MPEQKIEIENYLIEGRGVAIDKGIAKVTEPVVAWACHSHELFKLGYVVVVGAVFAVGK
jgi:hypothetical protein